MTERPTACSRERAAYPPLPRSYAWARARPSCPYQRPSPHMREHTSAYAMPCERIREEAECTLPVRRPRGPHTRAMPLPTWASEALRAMGEDPAPLAAEWRAHELRIERLEHDAADLRDTAESRLARHRLLVQQVAAAKVALPIRELRAATEQEPRAPREPETAALARAALTRTGRGSRSGGHPPRRVHLTPQRRERGRSRQARAPRQPVLQTKRWEGCRRAPRPKRRRIPNPNSPGPLL